MKRLMLAVLAITFVGTTILSRAAMAQVKEEQKKETCYLMKKGKVFEVKDDKETPLKANVTLKNGTVIMPNGHCKMKDGKSTMLKDGECMREDGKLGKHAEHMHADHDHMMKTD